MHERRRALAGATRGGRRGSRSRGASAPDLPGRFGILEGRTDTNANAAIALIREIAPRNGVEALLAAQVIAVHNAALELLRRVVLPDQPGQFIDSLPNRATRLLRLYVDQVEALDRLRGGGARQTVRVERVTVEAGGQAVVGAVTTAPPGFATPAAWQEGAVPGA